MKFFAPVVVGIIAFFSASVDANGVCYDPDHTSGKSASTVSSDMQTIAGAGFNSVRTYISKFGNTEMGPIITGAGLTAVLGVPYPQSDYQEQMEAAISAANSGGVSIIMVGNENLAGAGSVPSDMISVIQSIKSRVSGNVKVGTVQRNTEVINYQSISGWSDLVSACDVLGVNVHPFFNPGTSCDDAIDVVNTQWQTMMSNFGSKLLLTETGWPSSGSSSGNTGSLECTQKFYSAYQQWSSSLSEKFYFQMFDIPSKSELYEQTFGLYSSDGQSKFTMSMSQSSTTQSSNQQQQQQQTSAPTTAAPTPEPTPEPTTAAPTPTPTPESTPEQTTAAPTEAPDQYQNSTSSSASTAASASVASSTSGSSEQVGSASLSGSNDNVGSTTQDSKSGSKKDSKTGTTTEQTQSAGQTSSIGKSSETQQQTSSNADDTQQANTQSAASSSSGTVMFAVGGGGCAVLIAFGFIYQARKRADELANADDKDDRFSVITPVENICAL